MTAAAEVIAAGGLAEIGANIIPATLTALAFLVPLALVIRYLRRRSRITHVAFGALPGEEIDVPDFVRQPKRPAPPRRATEPFLADGVTDAIHRMLSEGDGRA